MIGRIMQWLLHRTSPKAKVAEEAVTESAIAREDKRSAVSRLVAALDNVEIERDLDHLSRWSSEPRRGPKP